MPNNNASHILWKEYRLSDTRTVEFGFDGRGLAVSHDPPGITLASLPLGAFLAAQQNFLGIVRVLTGKWYTPGG